MCIFLHCFKFQSVSSLIFKSNKETLNIETNSILFCIFKLSTQSLKYNTNKSFTYYSIYNILSMCILCWNFNTYVLVYVIFINIVHNILYIFQPKLINIFKNYEKVHAIKYTNGYFKSFLLSLYAFFTLVSVSNGFFNSKKQFF